MREVRHDQRTVVEHAVVRVREHAVAVAAVLHGHDAALPDEEARDHDRVLQEAAAIAGEVEHQAIELLPPDVGEDAPHVPRAQALGRVPVAPVEGRQVEDAEPERLPIDLGLLDAQLGRLLFEVDRVALDGDVEALGGLALAQHGELDARALAAPDQAHDVPQRHVDDVDRLLVLLGHGDDAVARFEDADAIRRATGDDLLDHRVAIPLRERDADALERELHLDLEVLPDLGREIGGVRVEGAGEGVEEGRVEILAGAFFDALGEQLVAMHEAPLGFLEIFLRLQVVRDLEVDERAQQVVGVRPWSPASRGRPGRAATPRPRRARSPSGSRSPGRSPRSRGSGRGRPDGAGAGGCSLRSGSRGRGRADSPAARPARLRGRGRAVGRAASGRCRPCVPGSHHPAGAW